MIGGSPLLSFQIKAGMQFKTVLMEHNFQISLTPSYWFFLPCQVETPCLLARETNMNNLHKFTRWSDTLMVVRNFLSASLFVYLIGCLPRTINIKALQRISTRPLQGERARICGSEYTLLEILDCRLQNLPNRQLSRFCLD